MGLPKPETMTDHAARTLDNAAANVLIALGLSTRESFEPFFPRVRDREDVAVLKCRQTGAIVLSRSDHVGSSYYETKHRDPTNGNASGQVHRASTLRKYAYDDERRAEKFRETVRDRRWLDIGTGAGGILELLGPEVAEAAGVEPNRGARELLRNRGFTIFERIEDVPKGRFDVVTLFHTLEHFVHPLESLATLREKIALDGRIVVEVPHAGDILLSLFNVESFKAFTLWSEHLILHTPATLESFLAAVGFSRIVVEGFQRFPLANHLRWLARGEPGGHVSWDFLRSAELDHAYANLLRRLCRTDTLIATAQA